MKYWPAMCPNESCECPILEIFAEIKVKVNCIFYNLRTQLESVATDTKRRSNLKKLLKNQKLNTFSKLNGLGTIV